MSGGHCSLSLLWLDLLPWLDLLLCPDGESGTLRCWPSGRAPALAVSAWRVEEALRWRDCPLRWCVRFLGVWESLRAGAAGGGAGREWGAWRSDAVAALRRRRSRLRCPSPLLPLRLELDPSAVASADRPYDLTLELAWERSVEEWTWSAERLLGCFCTDRRRCWSRGLSVEPSWDLRVDVLRTSMCEHSLRNVDLNRAAEDTFKNKSACGQKACRCPGWSIGPNGSKGHCRVTEFQNGVFDSSCDPNQVKPIWQFCFVVFVSNKNIRKYCLSFFFPLNSHPNKTIHTTCQQMVFELEKRRRWDVFYF